MKKKKQDKLVEETEKEAKEIKEKMMPTVSVYNRQLDLLKKRYVIDDEKKIVHLPLRYEKASDILETDVGRVENPQFKNEVVTRIKDLMDILPINYKVDVEFEISDYEGYDPKEIMDAFNDSLELTQYSSRRQRRNKWLISTILVLIGIFLLFFMAVGKSNEWFGTGVNEDIIVEIIDIAGWVFIWEAVSLLFLEPTEQTTFALKMRQRISSISFYRKENHGLLISEKAADIFSKWKEEGQIKRFGKACLLGSSAAFIAMAFFSLFSIVGNIKAFTEISQNLLWLYIAGSVFSILFHLLAGFGGINKYMGKDNWLAKSVAPIAIVMCVIMGITITLSAISNSVQGLVSSISSFVINIFYVFGYFTDRYMN